MALPMWPSEGGGRKRSGGGQVSRFPPAHKRGERTPPGSPLPSTPLASPGSLGESLAGRWRAGVPDASPSALATLPSPSGQGSVPAARTSPGGDPTPSVHPGATLPVLAPCPLGCRGRNSAGDTDQESHRPGDRKPPALRGQDLEGQETGFTRVLLRCPAPSRGPSQGESGQLRASGSISLSPHFHEDTSISSKWESPCQWVSKKGRGGHFKSLSWRARSLELRFPAWLRQ